MPGVFAGIVVGVFVFVALALTKHDPIMGLNAGFVGLRAIGSKSVTGEVL